MTQPRSLSDYEYRCKTCGGVGGQHKPTILDADGIGAAGHRMNQMTQPVPDSELEKLIERRIKIASTETKSVDPVVQIAWLADGIKVWFDSNGKSGNSPADARRYIISSITRLITKHTEAAAAVTDGLDELLGTHFAFLMGVRAADIKPHSLVQQCINEAKAAILAWHRTQAVKLAESVIGEDEYIPPTKPITKFSKPSSVDYRNGLRAEQRQALKAVKEQL